MEHTITTSGAVVCYAPNDLALALEYMTALASQAIAFSYAFK